MSHSKQHNYLNKNTIHDKQTNKQKSIQVKSRTKNKQQITNITTTA